MTNIKEIFEKRKVVIKLLQKEVINDKTDSEDYNKGLLAAYREELAFIDVILSELST